MFPIHGSKNGNYIPLVICLLPDKITEIYAYMCLIKLSTNVIESNKLFYMFYYLYILL